MPGKRQLHPHLYDRLVSAGVQPAYPRPPPPSRWPILVAIVVPMLGIALGATTGSLAYDAILERGQSSEGWLMWAMALDGGGGGELAMLAWSRTAQGRFDEAATLLRAEAEVGGVPALRRAEAARALALGGRCSDARAELDLAGQALATTEKAGVPSAHGGSRDPAVDVIDDARAAVEQCATQRTVP